MPAKTRAFLISSVAVVKLENDRVTPAPRRTHALHRLQSRSLLELADPLQDGRPRQAGQFMHCLEAPTARAARERLAGDIPAGLGLVQRLEHAQGQRISLLRIRRIGSGMRRVNFILW